MRCKHTEIGNLEYNETDLAQALSYGDQFWAVGVCLECKRAIEFRIERTKTRLSYED